MIKIMCVCGARPNFMKVAPIMRALHATERFHTLLVHTGQHYDENMSRLFFEQLQIPRPDVNLEVGSASHAVQTAEIMKRFETVVLNFKPDYVLVVGDVNSTIACGLVAVKSGVKLIHVEAGLRSFDRSMPEEINRILTDRISDLLFVTEQSGVDNLKREGIDGDKIYFVGNVMIDTLLANKQKAEKADVLARFGLMPEKFGVITLHRPSNVDNKARFAEIIGAFAQIQRHIKLIFPIHPRTRKNIEGTDLALRFKQMPNFIITDPVGYLDFLCLMSKAALVFTDSGGIQEETTILGVPCITIRDNTERPVTIIEGTNRLVSAETEAIVQAYEKIKADKKRQNLRVPELWDGQAARRIAEDIMNDYNHSK